MLSQEDDIVTLPKGRVLLRQSNLNISANSTDYYTKQKFKAKYFFLDWVFKNEKLLQKIEKRVSINELRRIIARHLFYEYRSHSISFLNINLLHYAVLNSRIIKGGLLKNIYRLLRYEFFNL
jgi:hypothetical protein